MAEIRNKILIKRGLIDAPQAEKVDKTTGEIVEESNSPTVKNKKTKSSKSYNK